MNSILLSNPYESNSILLTVAIPTYRRAKYLQDAINSVLMQDHCGISYEIIVVNNEPNQKMDELVSRYKGEPVLFYRNEENYGQVGNVNQCAMLARGTFIAYLHDDDLLFPNYFRTIKEYLMAGTYDCLLPEYADLNEKYIYDLKHKLLRGITAIRHLYKKRVHRIEANAYLNCYYNVYDAPTCGIVFKKSSLIDYGFFRDEHGAAWDYYNFRIYHQMHDVYILHACIGARRRYTGMTNTQKVQREFRTDGESVLEEHANHPFIKKYADCIYTKKPYIKYLRFRIEQDLYIYLKNLKRARPISLKEYAWIKDTFTI